MLTQRLLGDLATQSGTLTITADRTHLPELMALEEELKLRMNIETMPRELRLDPNEEQPPNG